MSMLPSRSLPLRSPDAPPDVTGGTDRPRLIMIAAMSENRVIGRDGGLPWRMPNDLRFFKTTTRGHPIIMGRKTWETVGHPLPDRTSIVVTRNRDYHAEDAIVTHTLDDAIAACGDVSTAFIIGGAQLYTLGLGVADEILLTRIHAEIEGDTFFPELPDTFTRVGTEPHPADARHPYAYTFERWVRRPG